jgi:hypothetical protein
MKCTQAPFARTALSLLTRTVDPCLATTKRGHLFSISVGHSLTTESYTHHHTHSHTQAWGFMCSLTVGNSRIGGASDVTNGREAIRWLFDRCGDKINTHTHTHTTVWILCTLSRPHISVIFMYSYFMSFMYMLCNVSIPTCLYKHNVCAFTCTH